MYYHVLVRLEHGHTVTTDLSDETAGLIDRIRVVVTLQQFINHEAGAVVAFGRSLSVTRSV